MTYRYKTSGVCSTQIVIDIDEENKTIKNVSFTGGCNGNLQGISTLVRGESIDKVIEKLKGIKCGFKRTSCPDQLACALEQIKAEL